VAFRLAAEGPATLGLLQPASTTGWDVVAGRQSEALPSGNGSIELRIFAVSPGDVLRTANRCIEVPIIPGVHTWVEFRSSGPVVVRLVDLPYLGIPASQLIARAQAFEESRQSEASHLLLARLQSLGVDSDVAQVLRGGGQLNAPQAKIASFLASSWPAEEVLSGQLWAVRTDTISE
jgi:hypothetical protein